MKNLRILMMCLAVLSAVGGAVATNASANNKRFVTAYVLAAPSSCQTTTKPDICNTIGAQFCTIAGVTFYQNHNELTCVTAWRKD